MDSLERGNFNEIKRIVQQAALTVSLM